MEELKRATVEELKAEIKRREEEEKSKAVRAFQEKVEEQLGTGLIAGVGEYPWNEGDEVRWAAVFIIAREAEKETTSRIAEELQKAGYLDITPAMVEVDLKKKEAISEVVYGLEGYEHNQAVEEVLDFSYYREMLKEKGYYAFGLG